MSYIGEMAHKRLLITIIIFNPLTAPACKMSGLRSAPIHAWKQHIWRSCNKSTFNTVRFDINLFTCSCMGRGGEGVRSLNDFKFGTFIGRFQSAGAASMAVKGLTGEWEHVSLGSRRTAWLTGPYLFFTNNSWYINHVDHTVTSERRRVVINVIRNSLSCLWFFHS